MQINDVIISLLPQGLHHQVEVLSKGDHPGHMRIGQYNRGEGLFRQKVNFCIQLGMKRSDNRRGQNDITNGTKSYDQNLSPQMRSELYKPGLVQRSICGLYLNQVGAGV